jgi:hypothetical protein
MDGTEKLDLKAASLVTAKPCVVAPEPKLPEKM